MKKTWTGHKEVKESVIEDYLVSQVMGIGGLCIKNNPRNVRGIHDRICVLPQGLAVFVEVKRPGGKPRKNQRETINRLRRLGHHSIWVHNHAMVDTFIAWCRKRMASTKVVGTDHECTRPQCNRRVTIPWKDYLQKAGSSN